VIYLDSSALVKLVFEEAQSNGLAHWLADQHDLPKISSELSTIELFRTCRRLHEDTIGARQVLAGLDLLPMTGDVVEQAALVGPADLRSLDAIHLASALLVIGDLTAFVAYDARLRTAAADAGLVVAAPA
jgi:predicted nucleic acid-binding protein